MRDIDQMREFVAAPSPPVARAGRGTLSLYPIALLFGAHMANFDIFFGFVVSQELMSDVYMFGS